MQIAGCDIICRALAKIEVGQRRLDIDDMKAIKNILNVDCGDILG